MFFLRNIRILRVCFVFLFLVGIGRKYSFRNICELVDILLGDRDGEGIGLLLGFIFLGVFGCVFLSTVFVDVNLMRVF